MPTSPEASFTHRLQDGGRIPTLHWDHVDVGFRRKVITTSGNWYPSDISEFIGKWSVGWGWRVYTSEKLAPKDIRISTEIASTSVSVATLILLPVWDTVCTSGLHLIVFSIVGRCWRKWKWIGHAQKVCRSRWDYVEMSSLRLVITTSGFGGFLLPVCICRQEMLPL